jgi:FlaA1/EpsC-like NDP-sugar epimerase
MKTFTNFEHYWKKTGDTYKRHRDASNEGAYLYGAGFIGRWAATYLESIGIPVLGFIDSDSRKWGTLIVGKPVMGPIDDRVIKAKSIFITHEHRCLHRTSTDQTRCPLNCELVGT